MLTQLTVGSYYIGYLFVTLFICWWINWKTTRFNRLLNKIPGPSPVPFLGSVLSFIGGFDKLLQMFQIHWPAKYGEIYRSYLIGSDCYVCLTSPELMEWYQVVLEKGSDYDLVHPWLGRGLLLSTGDKWRNRRRLLTPAFHFGILNSFLRVFNKQSRVLCGILSDLVQNKQVPSVDIHPLMARCALDIICDAAMGTKVHAQTVKSGYAKAVYKYPQIIVDRFFIRPWLINETLFSLTANGKEHSQLLTTLHTFTDNVILKRRAEINESKRGPKSGYETSNQTKKRRALLDLLLDEADKAKLSHEDIREEINTFMFEGHDTVASAMSWFLYCMATNPVHQQRVYEELRDVFGDSPERDCNQQDLTELKYLDLCIKESLRLCPSVPSIMRQLKQDIQLGDYLIPAGCTVALLIYGMHRNPRLFPDPLLFNPERFSPEISSGRHPFAFIPFSAGPRNCIGQRFAFMEEKVLMASLLRRFKFSVDYQQPSPVPSYQMVLKAIGGIHLSVSLR